MSSFPSPVEASVTDWAEKVPLLGVVSILAGEGSFDALQVLLAEISPVAGFAYVIIPNQKPKAGWLRELAASHAHIQFLSMNDWVALVPNAVVIAEHSAIHCEVGILRSRHGAMAGTARPIDLFCGELAAAYGARAVTIVLSGSGCDGLLGLADVKALGGRVFVQDPQSCPRPELSSFAISRGLADDVLGPRALAARLEQYARELIRSPSSTEDPSALTRVLHQLRVVTGHEFASYKRSTLLRRIRRRMSTLGVRSITEYSGILSENRSEVEALFHELLVRVTTFFRDAEVFESLREDLLRDFRARSPQQPFRVWVPACATGEEAYSLAILIRELLLELELDTPVQIFATDLDARAIDLARAGRFSARVAAEMGEARLERFMVPEREGYRVVKEIRELIVFASQNVIQDPPFSRLDLVSCRNLLIYLEPELQRQVLEVFGFSLRPSGLLVLGTAETVSAAGSLFETVHERAKLFRRRSEPSRAPSPPSPQLSAQVPGPAPTPSSSRVSGAGSAIEPGTPRLDDVERELQQTRGSLERTIEQLAKSNETLQSTNEELKSTNDELEGANAELEASRAALQALNDELGVVNSKLEQRNRTLSRLDADTQSLLDSLGMAVVFLDQDLKVTRFTTQARAVFRLRDTDIGRPLSDLACNLQYETLWKDAEEVLRSYTCCEREVQSDEGEWRLMRVRPCFSSNAAVGLVMSVIAIDRVYRRLFTHDEPAAEPLPDG